MSEDISSELKIKNDTIEAECSKPKKRRRGKKKRNRSYDHNKNMGEFDESKNLEMNKNNVENRKRPKLLIRPVDVPKAPENSTQFIIDDHDECHLYFSFETPNPYDEKNEEEGRGSDTFNDAACQDIDYEYHSMQDVDNTAYYLQDFELSYSKVRYEETMRLTKPDLVAALESLEVRVRELEHKMYEKDPSSALEQLQRKLLRLQEENITLREEQQHLRKSIGEDSTNNLLHPSESDHTDIEDSDPEELEMNDRLSESSDTYSFSELKSYETDQNLDYDRENEIGLDASDDETESSVMYGLCNNSNSDCDSEHNDSDNNDDKIVKNESSNLVDFRSKLSNNNESLDKIIVHDFNDKTTISDSECNVNSELLPKTHNDEPLLSTNTNIEHLSQNVDQLSESINKEQLLSCHVPEQESINFEQSSKSIDNKLAESESVNLPMSECNNELITQNSEIA